MFAYNALYGTPYTTNMLTAYSSALQTAIGFEEGIYADGALNKNTQVQTNQIILSSARYMNPSQISTTSTTNVASSSSISNSVSQTTVTVADQTTMTTVTYVSETSLLTILMMSIIIALIFIRVGNRRMVKRS
jgi:predicted S18 family serine protease